MELNRDEFLTHVQYLRDDIKAVQDGLDTLNGRTRQNEEAVAVLKAGTWKAGGVGAGGSLLLFMAWEWVKSKL